jgi:hypothetical protein
MKKQQRFFDQPFRKVHRVRRLPRLVQKRDTKKRKTHRSSHRGRTDSRLDDTRGTTEAVEWSSEQLERIWQNTSG